MQTKKILFPTDFSTASDAALDHATAIARDAGAMLTIVHVEEPIDSYGGELYYGIPLPSNPEVRRMLEKVVPAHAAVAYEYRLEPGSPAETIVRIAREEGADLIVMGTHGRTGMSRMLMGSVAEAVVRKAPCPVLTLRQPKGKKPPPKAATI
jgi:universal stress protein A